jgi:hypothetical protein
MVPMSPKLFKAPENYECINLKDLPVGAVLEVETTRRTYRVEYTGFGGALISGHPKYCPSPVSMAFSGEIRQGARMHFIHPELGPVSTSRVVAIRSQSLPE